MLAAAILAVSIFGEGLFLRNRCEASCRAVASPCVENFLQVGEWPLNRAERPAWNLLDWNSSDWSAPVLARLEQGVLARQCEILASVSDGFPVHHRACNLAAALATAWL